LRERERKGKREKAIASQVCGNIQDEAFKLEHLNILKKKHFRKICFKQKLYDIKGDKQ